MNFYLSVERDSSVDVGRPYEARTKGHHPRRRNITLSVDMDADFAKGLVGLLGNDQAIGEAFRITSDQVLSWNQIYFEAYQALGLEPNVVHSPSDLIAKYWPDAVGSLTGDKSNNAIFDNSKIKRFIPGFPCEVVWAPGVR